MAVFYTGTHRKRWFETKTEEALRRRGMEMLGLAMLAIGAVLALALFSYSPDDPSFFASTTASSQNYFGDIGAMISDLMLRSVGWSAWGLPVALGVWGARLLLHRGEERVVTRIILVPFAVALGAIFAAAHVPPAGWAQDFGLGGWFGDAMLGGLLTALPINLAVQLKIFTILLGLAFLALAALALGLSWREGKIFGNFLAAGVAHLMDLGVALMAALGVMTVKGAKLANEKRRDVQSRMVEKRAAAAAEAELVKEDVRDPIIVNRVEPTPRAPFSEPVEPVDEKRLMSRISEAIRNQNSGSDVMAEPAEVDQVDVREVAEDLPVEVAQSNVVRMHVDEPPLEYAEEPQDVESYIPLGGAHRDDSPLAAALNRKEAEASSEPLVKARVAKPQTKSKRAKAEEQPKLALEKKVGQAFELPPLGLLSSPKSILRQELSNEALESNARMLEAVLDDYGVKGEIVSVRPGPVVTMYELEPAPGLKASRVIGLADDIARSMSALAARVSTVPGRTIIGIELPNDTREVVMLREILSASAYGDANMRLPLALGKDIGGQPVVENLAKMPHLLIAGTTGSGKSVAINTMILSLLYSLTPEECRMIMIDPKMLELSVYDGIPHLLSPVVTDPKKAVVALKWVVAEMEERYRKMSKMGVRNIEGYNARVGDALSAGEGFSRTIQTGFDDDTGEPVFETEEFTPEKMAYIVVVVDEMADLMMVAGKEIEACIQRLAQMARASGIHLIMATQRPSVDVITGTIKANFPTRISFQVTSKVDSRTILGEMGAEQLLGQGDMLHMAGGGRITRVHGPFVSDEEVEEIVNHLKANGEPTYVNAVVEGPDEETTSDVDLVLGLGGNTTGEDALYDQAVAIVARDRKCSTSYIQRKLSIGYNKAAKLVEQMEDQRVVSAANHVGKREVLVPEVAEQY